MESIFSKLKIKTPDEWMRIETIEMHTGGEPLRIPISGLPKIQGKSVLEKRNFFKGHYDHIRTGLMFEPRGHADMYGAILSEGSSEDADFDVFFIHNEGYSTMCGHAIIALTKFVVEFGLFDPQLKEEIVFNVPAGTVYSRANIANDQVVSTSFINVPSYLYLKDKVVKVDGIGPIHFDVAFGGAFYAMVEADKLDLQLDESNYYQLIDYGKRIKQAVMYDFEIKHPVEKDLSFLYGTIFTGKAHNSKNHSRNVCIFAEGEVDRSATGSGVSARAGLHFAKGDILLNQPITIESILGSTMTVEAVEKVDFHGMDAVVPKVSGQAYFTGRNEFWLDPKDPYVKGFIFR